MLVSVRALRPTDDLRGPHLGFVLEGAEFASADDVFAAEMGRFHAGRSHLATPDEVAEFVADLFEREPHLEMWGGTWLDQWVEAVGPVAIGTVAVDSRSGERRVCWDCR